MPRTIQKKRHHFVPATYLRRFVDPEGFVTVVRKAEHTVNLRSKPTETGFRNFYYSQPVVGAPQNNNALEDLFSKIEESWPRIVESLEGKMSANSALSGLMTFIGFQRVRVPAFRDAIEQAMARFARSGLDHLILAGALPPPPCEFPDLMDHVAITIDPHQSIHGMTALLRQLGPILDSFGYSIIHNESEFEFITSDNPVSYYTSSQASGEMAPYLLLPRRRWELIFPISPTTAVFGSTADRSRYRVHGLRHLRCRSSRRVRAINEVIARFAYEAYFSRAALPQSFTGRFAPQSPVLSPDFSGFGPDDYTMPKFVFGERKSLIKWKPERD